MKKLSFFNHKGRVGKTTLTYNIANMLADLGNVVLVVDADPQCNLTSLALSNIQLNNVYKKNNNTISKALENIVAGSGDINIVDPLEISQNLYLLPGHINISEYESQLPTAWTESFAGYERGFRIHNALHRIINELDEVYDYDYVIYDIGPNIGPLNRSILLSCDYFAIPVTLDLFSLMAIGAVGKNIIKWYDDWKVVKNRVPSSVDFPIPNSTPKFLGYISQQFGISRGNPAEAFSYWKSQFREEINQKIVAPFSSDLIVKATNYELKLIKDYHNLVPAAQRYNKPIYKLVSPEINSGHLGRVKNCGDDFKALVQMITNRVDSIN